jgi:hypothetical protein
MTLRDLLAHDPVCRDIVQYLMHNNDAADTARGIAQWWIRRDVVATQEALMKLQDLGVVQTHVVQDSTSIRSACCFIRGRAKRSVVRQSLARYLDGALAPGSAN